MESSDNALTDEIIPIRFRLSQNYPNPFKHKTTIKYCVACRTRVVLSVFDSAGREARKLVDEEQRPGTYQVEFCATNVRMPDGEVSKRIRYKLVAGSFEAEKEMQLVR